MITIWFVLFLETVVAIPIHILYPNVSADIAIIILHCFTMWIFLINNKQYRKPLLVGFILRLAAMTFDCGTLILSHMNWDTIGYYESAIRWAEKGQLTYGGMYARLLGYLFKAVGPSRILAEYINVILGMTTVWMLYKSLNLIFHDKRIIRKWVWLLSIFPYSVYSSCVTYRESVIATMVAISAYFALRWYLNRSWNAIILCAVSLLFASTFHAGIILLGIGYAVLFTLYSHKTGKFMINRRSIFTLSIVLLCLTIVYVFPEIFFAKLNGINAESVIRQVNYESGGSVYLSWMNVKSIRETILYSPLKLLHFLFSPMPYDWRGIIDFIPFCIDSIWYFICLKQIIWKRQRNAYNCFIIALITGWMASAFVFGLGTWTAGTAIRHRNKIFEVLLIMAAVSNAGGKDILEIRKK